MFNLIFTLMKKRFHVVPQDEKWAVKAENAERASNIFDTQKEAIARGIELAKKNESELSIHGKDGKIREKNSYGNDNFPPKG